MAPLFKQMLDDPDGKKKLCIVEKVGEDGEVSYSVDPELTQLIWDQGFANEATLHYDFGSEALQERRDRQ